MHYAGRQWRVRSPRVSRGAQPRTARLASNTFSQRLLHGTSQEQRPYSSPTMFCPSCGSEERQASQYCRACGTDLRPVRVSLERPDSITASAVSAREEIGRAVAQKIREVEDGRDLKRVAEDVLPQIEKFLESYEEKRLRRVRAGVVTAASGFGTGILGLLMSAVLRGPDPESALIVCVLGVIAFALGLDRKS